MAAGEERFTSFASSWTEARCLAREVGLPRFSLSHTKKQLQPPPSVHVQSPCLAGLRVDSMRSPNRTSKRDAAARTAVHETQQTADNEGLRPHFANKEPGSSRRAQSWQDKRRRARNGERRSAATVSSFRRSCCRRFSLTACAQWLTASPSSRSQADSLTCPSRRRLPAAAPPASHGPPDSRSGRYANLPNSFKASISSAKTSDYRMWAGRQHPDE